MAGGVTDRDTFTITQISGVGVTTTRVFEFDSDGVFVDADSNGVPDNVLITYTQRDTDDAIAQRIVTVVGNAGLGLTPTYLGNGAVNIGGDDGLPQGSPRHQLVKPAAAVNLGVSGAPGVDQGTLPLPIPVPYINYAGFTASDVATAIQTAINDRPDQSAVQHGDHRLGRERLWRRAGAAGRVRERTAADQPDLR